MDQKTQLLQTAEAFIAEGAAEKALLAIINFIKDDKAFAKYKAPALGILAHHKKLEKQQLDGLLDEKEIGLQQRRITNATLLLTEDLKAGTEKLLEHFPEYQNPIIVRNRKLFLVLAVVFAALAILFATQPWKEKSFDLSLHFYGDAVKSKIIGSGDVKITYEGQAQSDIKSISPDGSITLLDLGIELRGKAIKINPSVAEYESTQIEETIPGSGYSLDIILAPKKFSTRLRGTLTDTAGKVRPNLLLKIGDYETTTDERGYYQLELPFKKGHSIKFLIFDQNNQQLHSSSQSVTDKPLNIQF